MKVTNSPILVCIDTNFFNQKMFDFSSISFQSLIKIIKEKSIKLIMVDIVEHEIREQIRKKIEVANKELSTVLNTPNCRFIKNEVKYLFKDHISKILEGFDDFLKETDAVSVSSSDVHAKEILTLYFNTTPPFGHKEIKKHEFPDAYICLSLKDYSQKNKERIYLVSKDKGIKQFCESNNQFLQQIKTLDELLDLVNKRQENYQFVVDYINKNLDKIKSEISDKVMDQSYILISDHADSDIDEVSARQVEIEEINIIYLDESTAEINITFKVNLLVEFSYAPDEATFYDSEDKRYYYMDHTQSSFEIDKTIPVYLELDLEDNDNIDIININVEEIEDTIEYYEPYDY
ncbi:PIN domain-containing protein [Legionella pneumophila]|uniref:DUF4935 domain-containing protein n=2 Tax=Legionella pneumophila TaxID=446 RepID=A0AAX2IW08_LEGPN|nr:PIN domain-containing protein [Legionella pneumophila]AMP89859.1 hypothetical protein AXF35_09245 [Legionella pneumophila subsp. pascullei]AMP92475.1 hypothetical protein AXF36_07555 [Legionella pneumophila subsp. pascullei]AMP95441.1 hypothetical protein AXF37_07445 [Legionella pneumophila subsp. pascullei]SQG90344.1 Uncharacterised protein [Legionella pneumophila subsp. pascullei]VEH06521.1 Uncharacterised protein [Legionella pneumophila subsp. pascullei]